MTPPPVGQVAGTIDRTPSRGVLNPQQTQLPIVLPNAGSGDVAGAVGVVGAALSALGWLARRGRSNAPAGPSRAKEPESAGRVETDAPIESDV